MSTTPRPITTITATIGAKEEVGVVVEEEGEAEAAAAVEAAGVEREGSRGITTPKVSSLTPTIANAPPSNPRPKKTERGNNSSSPYKGNTV